jgi:hypothetical protein
LDDFKFPEMAPVPLMVKDLTLRDYFAAQALMGMMASRNPASPRFQPEDDSAYVYAVADAILKARGS